MKPGIKLSALWLFAVTAVLLPSVVCAQTRSIPSSALDALDSENAVDPVGVLVFLDGEVDIHRDGQFLEWDVIDIGLEIEDYDLVQTGESGIAQVEITSAASSGLTVSIVENTAFYFDVSKIGGGNRTTIEMLTGSVTLKVQKLSGNNSVDVRTPAVVMGVRGTEFTVSAAPDGSYLVTCQEGEVACEDDSGAQRSALAGQVVEKTGDSFRSIAVPVTELGRYRTDWAAERERIFRTGAAEFIRAFAIQYRTFEPQFVDALTKLLEHRDVFNAWAQAYRSGETIPMAELLTQRNRVTPAIVAVRSVLPVYEQLYYRLKTLQRFHADGIGRTTIQRGLTSTTFFDVFARSSRQLERGLSVVRYYMKLYSRMTGFSDSSIVDDIFSGGNPINDSGPPKPTDPKSF